MRDSPRCESGWLRNKTVLLSVLEDLRNDPDERVRAMVRAKGVWKRAHPEDAKGLGDPE